MEPVVLADEFFDASRGDSLTLMQPVGLADEFFDASRGDGLTSEFATALVAQHSEAYKQACKEKVSSFLCEAAPSLIQEKKDFPQRTPRPQSPKHRLVNRLMRETGIDTRTAGHLLKHRTWSAAQSKVHPTLPCTTCLTEPSPY